VVWQAEKVDSSEGPALKLTYTSKDGEEDYPGALRCTVIYTLTNKNELKIEYFAETDKPTFVNLTNHSYFNLKDGGASDILGHELMIKASKFTPVDKGLIPTGKLKPVAGTPFDFNQPTAIGARVENEDEQLKFGKGYDHNWVLDRPGKGLELVASVYEPNSGRFMEVLTTNRACSSIVVILSTGPTKVRAARFTNIGPVSVWRRSIFQIRQTTLTFRQPS
jgi:aldose 1-epimerase